MAESYIIQAVLEAKDQMSSVFSSVASKTQTMGQTIGNQLTNSSSGFNRFNSTVGTALTGVGAATTAMGVTSVKSFGQFQQSLNTAAVVAGGTSKDISRLSEVANKMGADLPLSAQDCADAMIEMARNGASLEDIEKTFPAIAQAATGAGENIQTTAGVVQQAMNIWGSSLESPEQAAAILVQTANASNASIGSMQQALATIGGTATQAGVSMQDASTAIGLLTNKGFSAAQASQDLNHAMLQMAAPSKKAKKEMDALGISYTDNEGKMKPFKQILNEVADATNGMGDAQKQAALKTLFGTAGMQAMIPLLSAVKDESGDTKVSWDAFSDSIQKAAGNTETATKTLKDNASEMQKNVGAKVEQVGGNWESLRNKAMESKSGVSGSMLDMINDVLNWSTESDNGIAKVIRGFIGLSPVLGPALAGAGMFMTNFSKIASGVGTVAKASGTAIKGIGTMAVGAGKGVVGLTSKLLGNKNSAVGAGNASGKLSSIFSKTGSSASSSSSGVKNLGTSMIGTVQGAKASALNMAGMAAQTLAVGIAVGAATAGMALLVNSIANLASQGSQGAITLGVFAVAVGGLAGVFALLGPALTASSVGLGAFAIVMGTIGASVSAVILSLTALVAATTGLVAALNNFNMTGTQIITTLGAIGTGFGLMLQQFLIGVTTSIPLAVQAFVMMLTQMLAAIAAAMPQLVASGVQIIVSLLQGLAQGIPQIVAAGMDLITKFLQAIASRIGGVVASGLQIVTNFLSGVASQIGGVVEAGLQVVINFLNGIANKIGDVVTAAVNVIVSFINGVADNLGQIIQAGVNLLLKFIDGICNAIPQIAGAVGQIIVAFVEGIGAALGSILGAGTQLLDAFVRGFKSGFSKARSAGKGASNQGKDGAKSVDFGSVGRWIIDGLVNGIKGAAHKVMDMMTNIAKSALNAAKKFLGIHSPSRVMRDQVGKYIPAGIAVGIDKNLSAVTTATKTLTDAITPEIPNFNSIQPEIKKLNTDTSKELRQNLTNDFNIERQPLNIKLSIGGQDFERFSQSIDTTNTKLNKLSSSYSI